MIKTVIYVDLLTSSGSA